MQVRTIRCSAAAATAVIALTLTGCSGDSSGESGDSSRSTTSGDAKVVNDPGVEDIDLEDAVAKQTVKQPSGSGEITLHVFPLEVEGKVQTLRVGITPEFEGGESENLFEILGNNTFRPQLVDRDNLKVYSVVKDGAETWSIDNVDAQAKSGETIIAWAQYAAPEDDTSTFDVRIRDGWPAFTDVPVEK